MPTQPARPTSPYATHPPTQPPAWHALVGWDFIFNGLSTGLFITTSLGELVRPSIFAPLAPVAYSLALGLLLADLVCLVLDLGDPSRFHHMLRVFKPHSPMSLGVWSMTLFSFFASAAALLALLPTASPAAVGLRLLVGAVGLIPALATAVYKGVLFSTTAQPIWKDARWLGAYVTSSAFVLGWAQLLLIAVAVSSHQSRAMLQTALLAATVLNAAPFALLLRDVHAGLSGVYDLHRLTLALGALAIAGAVAPLVLLFSEPTTPMTITAVVLVIAANLFVRFEWVKLPHAFPNRPTT